MSAVVSGNLEGLTRSTAIELAASFPRRLRHPMRTAQDTTMARIGRNDALRAALFRLVDVAPACRSRRDLALHLGHLLADSGYSSRLGRTVAGTAERRTTGSVIGALARPGVSMMARRFIAGANVGKAAPELRRLWRSEVATTVDLLGEATVTKEEADEYCQRCDRAVRSLTELSASWPDRPRLESDESGSLPRANLSVKVTALCSNVRAEAPETLVEEAAPRLRQLLRTARDIGAHLHVDMESRDTRDPILDLLEELLSEDEFEQGPSVGCVLQAYLVDAELQLERVVRIAELRKGTPLTVRLVKGAYWDHETVDAVQRGWASPVFSVKAESDRCFERLTERLLDARPIIRPAIASHNLRSLAHAIAYDRMAGGDGGSLELQVLRGLGDDLQDALVAGGHRVRTYCPVGDLVAGMAYLVRRLLENTSNDSFLAARAAGESLDRLLEAP